MHLLPTQPFLFSALYILAYAPNTASRHLHHRPLHQHHHLRRQADLLPATTTTSTPALPPPPPSSVPHPTVPPSLLTDATDLLGDLQSLTSAAASAYLDLNRRLSVIKTLVATIFLRAKQEAAPPSADDDDNDSPQAPPYHATPDAPPLVTAAPAFSVSMSVSVSGSSPPPVPSTFVTSAGPPPSTPFPPASTSSLLPSPTTFPVVDSG